MASRYLTAALAAALAQGIPGATYREIADCGHCPMVEQPAAPIACMNDFLQGKP